MKSILTTSMICTTCLLTPAFAADLPSPVTAPVFVAPIPMNWSGCYVGGFGADDIARVRPQRTETLTTTANGNLPVVRSFTTTNQTGRTLNGGDGGGRVGCNYQTGRVVLGGQLEGGYLGVNGTVTDPFRRTSTTQIGGGAYGIGSIKLGYAVTDSVLLYIRGGVGYADLHFTPQDPTLGYAGSASGSQVMPLGGAGLEYKVTPNVGITGEYSYLRPGCRGANYASPTFTNVDITQTRTGRTTTCVDKHMISIGLNYYFSPTVPVVARY